MAIAAVSKKAKMILDYGKPAGKYTVNSLNPSASLEDVYDLHEAVKNLQGGNPAEVYFQTDTELAEE